MAQAPYPQLPTPEEVNTYQYDFSEKVWTPDAAVALCHVPWDSSYRDVARFASSAAKETYFENLRNAGDSIRLSALTILKYQEPIILNIPLNTATLYNYIIVDADKYPVTGQSPDAPDRYYYFIQDVEYLAPNATKFWIQLDVWQTYYENVEFNRCYIERGHIAIANENAVITEPGDTQSKLADYLTIPEGLDFGNEYVITDQVYWNFMETQPYVVVVSTTDLSADFGTLENPTLKSATGGIYDHIPNGCNVYAFSGQNFDSLMAVLSNYPWVAQGIIMITLVPRTMLTLGTPTTIQGITCYALDGVSSMDAEEFVIDNLFSRFNIPARYARLLKFFTSPYTFIEMTTQSGGEIVLKPECFDWFKYNTTYGVQFSLYSVVSPPHIRGMVFPQYYNSNTWQPLIVTGKDVLNQDQSSRLYPGEGLDIAVQIGNFPQLTLVNNQYLNYLASTVHTRNYLFENAEWSYNKAQAGAALGYNQGTNAMNVRQTATGLEIGAMEQRRNIDQLSSIATGAAGVVGGALNGSVGGVINAAANAGVNFAVAGAQTAVNTALASNQTQNVNRGAAYVRDTNLEYADYANKGDYQNAVHQIQAKVQDARLTQPSTIGQNGGEAFNISNGLMGVLFKFKRIRDQFVTTIGEYWFRYGYYVNTFLTPPENLACCTHFTYWKMHEIYLSSGTVPEVYKNTIRGIFQKGVTVWVNPADIGVVDPADNLPVEGVAY